MWSLCGSVCLWRGAEDALNFRPAQSAIENLYLVNVAVELDLATTPIRANIELLVRQA
jgi:hypothetical protein